MEKGTVNMREISEKFNGYIKKYKYVVIVILAGIILILLPSFDSDKSSGGGSSSETGSEENGFSLDEIEDRISQVLSRVEGAGKVEVILTLKSSTESILATDEESTNSSSSGQEGVSDSDIEYKYTTVVISTGSGTEQAVVLKRIYPEYMGALVVCDGAGNPSVRLKIVDAISSLTGLGADKITVIN